jgi:hypothetical protein
MDTNPKMVEIYTAHGMLDAETIRLFLQSYEIEAVVYQESAGIVYGLTQGTLGAAHIYVHEKDSERASQLIEQILKDQANSTSNSLDTSSDDFIEDSTEGSDEDSSET